MKAKPRPGSIEWEKREAERLENLKISNPEAYARIERHNDNAKWLNSISKKLFRSLPTNEPCFHIEISCATGCLEEAFGQIKVGIKNSYNIKNSLKNQGFKFDSLTKAWYKKCIDPETAEKLIESLSKEYNIIF